MVLVSIRHENRTACRWILSDSVALVDHRSLRAPTTDGPYGNFSGRDASRGLAKNSFDPNVLTPLDQPIDTLEDLTKDEIDSLNDWHTHFAGKYECVGKLVNEKSE
jgi:hypothetical protein